MDAREAARILAGYAKRFSAGAFATPNAKELAKGDGTLRVWTEGPETTVAVTKRVTRDGHRKDWTGRQYLIPAGTNLITHIGRTANGPIPNVDDYDLVYAYVEDDDLTDGLTAQGREPRAVRISAASEIITAWGRAGEMTVYPSHDRVTVAEVETPTLDPTTRADMLTEVDAVDNWFDDYPFYNRDGSWSAVSLRGFRRDDPQWGVKPSEMSKAWWADHPEARDYLTCEWTILADDCPAIVDMIRSVGWWDRLERVRLLRMSGRGGKGGQLLRHTDITDKAGGTADGQIVRFHFPLITDPAIVMHTWGLDGVRTATHLAPWRLWYLDARKPHAVVNPTACDRIHLVIDAVVNPDVRKQIAAAAR